MRLKNSPDHHLTYCTNIHPGETWQEVFQQLKQNIPALKSRIAPHHPFGIGLRLSAVAATELLAERNLPNLMDWLDENNLYVFTMNGFPYGSFHRQRVKDQVYAPDWREENRVEYTLDLVKILAELLPQEMEGGISTSPLSYKLWLEDDASAEQVYRKGSQNLARVAWEMARIQKNEGKILHLDIEPEPDCLLENSRETILFFKEWLFPVGGAFLSEEHGINQSEAEKILRHHIRICYDTCHFAVEYEDPREALNKFQEAGILIGKTQVSAALKVDLDIENEERVDIGSKLRNFEESTYLHQVIERREDYSLYHYGDLSEALPHILNEKAREWRVHYHVPVFVDRYESLRSTQDDILKALPVLLQQEECKHFEIETYTWEVLPENMKANVVESIEREFRWVLEKMGEELINDDN